LEKQGVTRGLQRCACACHWDWSWLKFGDSRISPTDVDQLFVVERKGWFLFIETKRPHEVLSDGQKILLSALSLVPKFWVVVLRGEKSEPSQIIRVVRLVGQLSKLALTLGGAWQIQTARRMRAYRIQE
jgi:hypothetical protein